LRETAQRSISRLTGNSCHPDRSEAQWRDLRFQRCRSRRIPGTEYDMLRWLGRLLLHSAFLLLANMVAIKLTVVAYAILIRAGAQLPLHLLDTHILWRSLMVGFLAGVLPVGLLLASFGWLKPLASSSEPQSIKGQPKFWTWVPYSLWMLFGTTGWILGNWNHSVLTTTSGPPIAGAFRVFFIDSCGRTGTWADFLGCQYQVEYSVPWVLSIGYSLAAIPVFLRSQSLRPTQDNEDTI
jgi:hypothetical protein